jgi:Family of unknown function (DUF5946)
MREAGPGGAQVPDRLRVNTTCPGCGLALPAYTGPTHAYVGASAACWRLYGRLSSDPFSRREGTRLRRLVVDAYAAQHPGVPHRRAMQSVAVHLMGLCVLLERDGEMRRLSPVLGRMPARKTMDLHWLAPPDLTRCVNAADVLAAGPGEDYAASAEAWAKSVWAAWRPHHETVRGWLDAPCQRDG